jgi:hypothetical protein
MKMENFKVYGLAPFNASSVLPIIEKLNQRHLIKFLAFDRDSSANISIMFAKISSDVLTVDTESHWQCQHCGNFYSYDDDCHATEDGPTCEACFDDDYFTCEESDRIVLRENCVEIYYKNSRGSKVSKIVASDEDCFFLCAETEELWHNDEKITAYDHRGREVSLSPSAIEDGEYYSCADCGDYFHCDMTDYVEGHGTICQGCRDNGDYSFCEDCGETIVGSCEIHSQGDTDGIRKFNFRPGQLNFRGKNSKKIPFIGFELEIEGENASLSSLVKIVREHFSEEEIFLKEDGSLTDGFEIVSHPATLEEHKKLNYEPLLNSLKNEGARSHDTSTCGLHFHLDRREMDQNHRIRFGAFFALNKERFETLARRSSPNYAAFKNKNLPLCEFATSVTRYEAVNWKNENTVEVRIFRGTLKYSTFIASMELVHAVYEFTADAKSMNGTEFDSEKFWERFISFVSKRSKKFSNLISYLKLKKFRMENVSEAVTLATATQLTIEAEGLENTAGSENDVPFSAMEDFSEFYADPSDSEAVA